MRRSIILIFVAALLAVPPGLTAVTAVAQPPPPPAQMVDLLFLMDGSGSIDPIDWETQRDGYAAALQDPTAVPLDGSVAVGLVQWAAPTSSVRVEIPLTVINNQADVDSLVQQIQNIPQLQGGTNPGDGLRKGADEFATNARTSAKQVACMSTDGTTNGGENLSTAAPHAQSQGVDEYTVVGIEDPGVNAATLQAHYGPHVFGGGAVDVSINSSDFANLIVGACFNSAVDLIGLEVNQSVQTWQHTVPLVADKSTVVRAFVQSKPNDGPQTVSGRLFGTRNGSPLPNSPLSAMNFGSRTLVEQGIAARRAQLDASLNFLLPDSWANGAISLRFEAGGTPLTCREVAGPTPNDCSVDVTFQPEPNASIKYIATPYLDGAGNTVVPTLAQLMEQASRMTSILPVAKVNATTDQLFGQFSSAPDAPTMTYYVGYQKNVLDACTVPACKDLYYGVASGNPPTGIIGLAAGIPETYASSYTIGTDAELYMGDLRNVAGHEVGHLLGLHHAVDASFPAPSGYKAGKCGELADLAAPDHPDFGTITGSAGPKVAPLLGPLGNPDTEVWGVDTRFADNRAITNAADVLARTELAIVDPYETGALMGYCFAGSPQHVWPSASQYEGLIPGVESQFRTVQSSTNGNHVIVTGIIDLSVTPPTVDLKPVRSYQGTFAAPPSGDYAARLRRADNSIVATVPFEPDVTEGYPRTPGGPEPPPVGLFYVPVPTTAAYTKVEILKDGQVIRSATASANTPTVNVPASGAVESGGQVRFSWNASDADGDRLTFDVRYSPDGGVSWTGLAAGISATSVEVPHRLLEGSTNAVFEVVASDGVLSASDRSGPFTVTPNAPEIFIRRPTNGQSFFSGVQLAYLQATAFDREDESVTVKWTSNRGGQIATGASATVRVDTLAEGDHTLTATATDSDGKTSSKTVDIHVVRVPPPPAMLIVDKDGTGQGSVKSTPLGLDCGTDCMHTFIPGSQVTLRAEPADGSRFAGWTGACSGAGACTVTMSQARFVTATFTEIPRHSLIVSHSGTGSGTVTSTPSGIDCGSACVHGFNEGTTVTLSAAPASGSYFEGWSGGSCSGTGPCQVTMSQGRSVTATFTRDTIPPSSRIGHPRHGHTYKAPRLRVSRGTSRDLHTPINRVDVALQQKLTNGKCRWWTGTRFRLGSCSEKRWKEARGETSWSYRIPRLKPSAGTNVRYYRVFSRAYDANKVERTFTRGRNANAFEIRPRRSRR